MSNNLIGVQQMKNVYNTRETNDKAWLIEYQVPFYKSAIFFGNYMITDHKLDVLCLTETWLKPDEHILLNESAPQGVATIYSNTLSISQKTGFKYNSFEVMVLHITLSREKCIDDKSPVMFVLATAYRPPGHHLDFIK